MKLLAIFAAASLTGVFPHDRPAPTFQFAGSDQLAFQITQGAQADVFAAASPKYPEQLYAQGLCSKPVAFATNTVVLIVPRANPARIHSVYDLQARRHQARDRRAGRADRRLHAQVLANLGLSDVLENVVSQEDDVQATSSRRSRSARPTRASSTAPTSKPVGNKVFRDRNPRRRRSRPCSTSLHRPTHAQHPLLATAFVREVLSQARRSATLRAAGFGLP